MDAKSSPRRIIDDLSSSSSSTLSSLSSSSSDSRSLDTQRCESFIYVGSDEENSFTMEVMVHEDDEFEGIVIVDDEGSTIDINEVNNDEEGGEDKVRSDMFKKEMEDNYMKMVDNPDAFREEKLKRVRRKVTVIDKFDPSPELLSKARLYKQYLAEKYDLIEQDPMKFKRELMLTRKIAPGEPVRMTVGKSSDMMRKFKKLNIRFADEKDRAFVRERSKSQPSPFLSPLSRFSILVPTFSVNEVLKSNTPPRFVTQPIKFLNTEEVLKTEGLFRIAGNLSDVDSLWKILDTGGDIPPTTDIHAVTNILKKFLRQLSEPLFTYKYHKIFLEALTKEAASQSLKETLGLLPEPHQAVIRELFIFLKKVTQYSSCNMMHSINLGIVFGPTLLRDASEAVSMDAMFDNRNDVVTQLIDHYDDIFLPPVQ